MSGNGDKPITFQGSKPRFFNKKKEGDPTTGGREQFEFRSKKGDQSEESGADRAPFIADDGNKVIQKGGGRKQGFGKGEPFTAPPQGGNLKADAQDQCKFLVFI